MRKILYIAKKIEEFAPLQNGVFSTNDLKNIINPKTQASFYRALSELVDFNIINKFCRNYYITKDFDLLSLSQRITEESYISFGTVLAKNLLIGSIPKYRVMAIKKNKTRIYENETYSIKQFKIKNSLFTGFTNQSGINIATPEKAFLDTLYYYQKGVDFSFDIYTDIDLKALNKNLINEYLELYNKNFNAFVQGVLNGKY